MSRPSTGRTNRQSGLSLVEVAIGSALLLLLLGGLVQALIATRDHQKRREALLELEKQTLLSLGRLTSELQESSRSVCQIQDSGRAVVFPLPRDPDARLTLDTHGNLLWSSTVCYYFDSSQGALLRMQAPITTPTGSAPDPLLLSPAQSLTFFLDGGYPRKPMARNLLAVSFENHDLETEAELAGMTDSRHVLRVSLEAQIKTGEKSHGLELEMDVFPRN